MAAHAYPDVSEFRLKRLAYAIADNRLDPSIPFTVYMSPAKLPIGKDEQRIYDILKKSRIIGSRPISVCNANLSTAVTLARTMNSRIRDEQKRLARCQACRAYGLTAMAQEFRPRA